MGLVKQAADLAFTFRFIRMLVLDWKDWDAYKAGVIDENGKRVKSVRLDSDETRNSYTPFIRLAANVKRLLNKIPGGGSKLGSFAAALYLIKEKYNLKDKQIEHILNKVNVDTSDILSEGSQWFILENKQISPGIYRVLENKMLNTDCAELVNAKDQIRICDDSFPVGNVFGIDIYEAKHIRTGKEIYVTINEIYK